MAEVFDVCFSKVIPDSHLQEKARLVENFVFEAGFGVGKSEVSEDFGGWFPTVFKGDDVDFWVFLQELEFEFNFRGFDERKFSPVQ